MVYAIRRRGASLGVIVSLCGVLWTTGASAQGLGAGALQGTVKDPTGGVMQAVEVRDQQSGHRLHADGDDGCGGPVRVQQPAAESLPPHRRGAGISDARARRRRAQPACR